jgi:hypothetical protein
MLIPSLWSRIPHISMPTHQLHPLAFISGGDYHTASTTRAAEEDAVPEPRLYAGYSAEQAISLFGSPAEAESLCNGEWLIFPKTVICLANIGSGPGRSYLESESDFCWVADRPYSVNAECWSNRCTVRSRRRMA